MTNRPRRIGTGFESMCVGYLRERLGDDRIERRAPHGSKDMGDVFGIVAHGHEGIAECKCHKTYGPALLSEWQEQTVAERGNAGADFALLVVHEPGCGKANFGRNSCYMQVRDLEAVMGGDFRCLAGELAMDMWVRVTMDDACRMMLGDYGRE